MWNVECGMWNYSHFVRWRVIQWRIKKWVTSLHNSLLIIQFSTKVSFVNKLCILFKYKRKMKMIRAFCSFNDFMFQALWKQVFNSLHHKLIRLKPIIFLENQARCAKIAFGIKLIIHIVTYFIRVSVILAAMLHFLKESNHEVVMWLLFFLIKCLLL